MTTLTWTQREVPSFHRTPISSVDQQCMRSKARTIPSSVNTRPKPCVASIVAPSTRRILLTCAARLQVNTSSRCETTIAMQQETVAHAYSVCHSDIVNFAHQLQHLTSLTLVKEVFSRVTSTFLAHPTLTLLTLVRTLNTKTLTSNTNVLSAKPACRLHIMEHLL